MKRIINEKIELKIANAVASVEMEGMIFPAWEIELIRQYTYGEITEAEFLESGKGNQITKIPNEILNSRSE